MDNYLIYSVLQYKHSLTLGESINVGILFYFPNENIFKFASGDGYRAKAIYPDFDNSLFNSYLKTIILKVNKQIDLFNEKPIGSDFGTYIRKFILAEDAAGLIFNNPVYVNNVFQNSDHAISEFSKLLLPGIDVIKPSDTKHNENYIIRKFNGYLFGKDKSIENKITKNEIIKTKHFNIKFDFSYQSNTHIFIRPISFDFSDESSIQNKAAIYFSYLSDLSNCSSVNNSRFDFLISKPQNLNFNRAYENAIDFIDSVKTPKKLVFDDQLELYSDNIISELS